MWEKVIELGTKVMAVAGPVIAMVLKWVEDNKEKINAIVLRIQKDMQSGAKWSKTEQEQLAVDLFFQEIHPRLPWWAKVLGKNWWEKRVRKVIKHFTRESHLLKEKIKSVIESNKEGEVKNGS